MTKLFGKVSILLIFKFIFICNKIHSVHTNSCISHHACKVGYVQVVALELARNLHVALRLRRATPTCQNLERIATGYVDQYGAFQYTDIDNDDPQVVSTVSMVHNAAYNVFWSFNNDQDLLALRPITQNRANTIFVNVDKAIHRLLQAGYFDTNNEIIVQMKQLKNTYCPNSYPVRGLLIEGVVQGETITNPTSLLQHYPTIATDTQNFASIDPIELNATNLLYVGHAEMAVSTMVDHDVLFLGSGDATTTLIIILENYDAGVYGILHACLDDENLGPSINRLVTLVVSRAPVQGGRIDLYLIGGSVGEEELALETYLDVLEYFAGNQHVVIHLKVACIGPYNIITDPTTGIGSPHIFGAGISLRTRQVYPASFLDRGPDAELRLGRVLTGEIQVADIYNYTEGLLEIGPYEYDEIPYNLEDIIAGSDDNLNEALSASFSNIQDPNFVRQALMFLRDNPDPAALFPNGKPYRYSRDYESGLWVYEGNGTGSEDSE